VEVTPNLSSSRLQIGLAQRQGFTTEVSGYRYEMSTQEELRAGDKVSWNTPQGRTQGVVIKRLISNTTIKDFHITASRTDPQFLVRSDKSGQEAAHRPSALRKLRAKP
jgi:Hypervirulence associated proteins TUDOR domain